MIAPKKITLHIDGQLCEGEAGQTILDIARTNNLYIPTLCYLKHLSPWGGCRLCIVEIEGSPKIVPSCATPAADGSRIITKSDRLHNLRKATLELLFSERNHICPMCPSNKGDCGLQHQGYIHGISGIRYPYLYPAMPVDVTAKYFGQDHNRCILCTRCVRTCDEQEGVHTLDVAKRGIKNLVVVDMNQTFAESSTCTQCGACVENCPTGALFDKSSAFRGQITSAQTVLTTCSECPVGCGLKVFTKENRIVNVWGDFDSPVSQGHLCVKGRYETWAEPRPRITQPLIRGTDGKLKPASWNDALKLVRKTVTQSEGWQRALLLSPRLTNETIETIKKIGETFDRVATFVAPNEAALCAAEPTGKKRAPVELTKINDADAIIVLGATPSRDNGVVAARIRRAVRKGGAKLVIFNEHKSDLDTLATIVSRVTTLEGAFWQQVGDVLKDAQRPVLVYGPGAMTTTGVAVLDQLIKIFAKQDARQTLSLIPLPVSLNSTALAAAGIEPVEDVAGWLDLQPLNYLHLVVSDEPDGGARLLHNEHLAEVLKQIDCLVVQASYSSALTEMAHVVLPAAIWAEKTGTITNVEGRQLPLRPVLPLNGGREDAAILESVFA
jgi:formate dehydrogenase major subunit